MAENQLTASAVGVQEAPRRLDPVLFAEAQRQFDICNACRYCEGLCSVFPALERRTVFGEGDILFLANLCHDCRACYDACPYSSPHEFAIDIPPLMTRIRTQTYISFSLPLAVGRSIWTRSWMRPLLTALIALVAVVLALVIVGIDELSSPRSGPGSFYELVPFAAMTIPAFALSGVSLLWMVVGVRRFWRDTSERRVDLLGIVGMLYAALTLENMRGGGPGCTYPEETHENRRALFHALVFYGFGGTFIATVLAAVWQELLGLLPPYPILSPPVLFGLVGGTATVAGCVGLLTLKRGSRDYLSTPELRRLDLDFIVTLMLINLTGLVLLLARSTAWMGLLLVIHLALVAAFFTTLPYGKFVHATYRSSSLLQDAIERREG